MKILKSLHTNAGVDRLEFYKLHHAILILRFGGRKRFEQENTLSRDLRSICGSSFWRIFTSTKVNSP